MSHRHVWHSLNREGMRLVGRDDVRREVYADSGYGFRLHRYDFPGGHALKEKVQGVRWTEFGPQFFLALASEKGNWQGDTLWSQESIAQSSGASRLAIADKV